ncbi:MULTISPECIES: ATP-binding cassette domain-containing protein [Paenibacillus]|uniref:ATP-binding cassette domain-containing protein n=1 Tax=Paenibacillus TaxID=44249 RepID=UPI002FDFA4ED
MIILKNVSKTIGNEQVLNNIQLTLEDNKIHAFFGANGSGKTMLFRVVCGLVKPTEGEIIIHGKTLHRDLSFPQGLGVIIESPGFWDRYTGFENLKVLASIQNKISNEEISEALNRVGLDPKDSRVYKKYSLGMKQRLAMAQAIMEKPDILVLDEPTNALDEEGVERIRNIILEEKLRGATVLIASHNKEDLEILADKRYLMRNGSLKEEIEAGGLKMGADNDA